MRCAILSLILLAGCAVPQPRSIVQPLPKVVAPHYAPLSTIITPPTKTYWLAWNYTYDDVDDTNAIVFNVRSLATNQIASPSYSWPIIGRTNGMRWPFQIDPSVSCRWFTVTASNTVTKMESGFATP